MWLIFCHLNSFRRKEVLQQTKKLQKFATLKWICFIRLPRSSYSWQSLFYWLLLTHIRCYCSSKLLLKVTASHFAALNTTGYRLVVTQGALFRKIQGVERLFSKSRSCTWEFCGATEQAWTREVSRLLGEGVMGKREAEGGTSPTKGPVVQLKSKE